MSDDVNNQVLDLNALYGVDKPLKVLWGAGEYVMRRPQAFGPRDLVTLEDLQKRAVHLQNLGAGMTDAQAIELENVLNQLLAMVCPEMPTADMPFVARARIAMWYFKQVSPEQKKMTTTEP